jgi:hypothetical protein
MTEGMGGAEGVTTSGVAERLEGAAESTWRQVARRMESCARFGGAAIIIARVVVFNGRACFWLRPEVRTLEPRTSGEEFLALLLE